MFAWCTAWACVCKATGPAYIVLLAFFEQPTPVVALVLSHTVVQRFIERLAQEGIKQSGFAHVQASWECAGYTDLNGSLRALPSWLLTLRNMGRSF